jgi:hypothetical protein
VERSPFTLHISTSDALAVPGSKVPIEFRLENAFAGPVHACIGSTEIMFSSRGGSGGTVGGNISGGCCMLGKDFVLPAGFSLLWTETREVPAGSVGEGFIRASLVICSDQDPVTGASKNSWKVSASTEKLRFSGR